MYLLDTNIWLELLLEKEKSREVTHFLQNISSDQLYITDFGLHSIAIIMGRLGSMDSLLVFIHDLFEEGATNLVHLIPEDFNKIIHFMNQYKLDFDDAYQYTAATKYKLQLVSFDTDFDHTEGGRKTPSQIN